MTELEEGTATTTVFVSTEAGEALQVPEHAWKRAYILDLMKHGIISVAARNIGKRIYEINYARRIDPDFDLYVKEAVELAHGELEYQARLRAIAGSDFLMAKMLEANIPEKYGRNAAPTGDVYVKAYIGFSPEEWDKQNGVVEGELVDKPKPPAITDGPEHKADWGIQAPPLASPGDA